MTSKKQSTFVYFQLPETNEIVVAGRYTLDMTGSEPVGRFVYGLSYLARREAIPIDPENLPLQTGEFETVRNAGLFGVLRDAAPDYWGRLIIDRRGLGTDTELQYLLETNDARVGALSFGPTSSPAALNFEGLFAMEDLQRAAKATAAVEGEIAGEPAAAEEFYELLHRSSPMGGARPKTVIIDQQGQLWVAKFPARKDRWNNALIEGSFLTLAKGCGICTPETQIVHLPDGVDVLLVKRFDQEPRRNGVTRRPFISAYSLFDLDEYIADRSGWSYLDFAQIVAKTSAKPREDCHELFRRAVFNALVSNLDDHPRNHAMIYESAGWRLSPAYDLTPSRTQSKDNRELAMICGTVPNRERWANRKNLVSGAGYFDLSQTEAEAILSSMKSQVLSEWENTVTSLGGSSQDCANISHAIVSEYPGFEYDHDD